MTVQSTGTQILTRGVRRLIRQLGRLPRFGDVDLGSILSENTEGILNLPTRRSFFPTAVSATENVERLLRRLYPVKCEKPLIRLGPNSDGGYLIPDDLDGVAACFSPGVSDIAGFERDCADRGMEVFMADASVNQPPELHSRFHFVKKFIGAVTQGESISMEDWVDDAKIPPDSELLLQMDIEGCEYETILSMPQNLQRRFRIVVVEFHHLDYLFCEPVFGIYARAFEKLLATHGCVHIHPNNVAGLIKVGGTEIPQMAEFTFLRRDRAQGMGYAVDFPHPLDRDNVTGAPVILPKSCYSGERLPA